MLALVRRSPLFAMGGICPPLSLFDSASSLSRDLQDARQSSSQPGVSSSAKRFAAATPVQPGPSHGGDPASAGPSRRRSFDSPQGSLGHSFRQGSDTPPRRRFIWQMKMNRLTLADNGTINKRTRTIFVLLRWRLCWITSPASFQLPPSPWSSLPPNAFTSWRLGV